MTSTESAVPERRPFRKPKFEPTPADRAIIKNLAAMGANHEDMCLVIRHASGKLGISQHTLRRAFKEELQTARTEIHAMAMSSVVRGIQNGEAWATCFYLKCRAGWKERSPLDDVSEITVKRLIGVPEDEI